MENKEIIIEELNAVKEIRDICKDMTNVFDNELDTIENGLQELADTIAGLERKCSLHDYWRDMAHRYGKILDILKKCPFVLDSIYRNTNNTEFSKRYQFGTITDKELNVIRDWLGL